MKRGLGRRLGAACLLLAAAAPPGPPGRERVGAEPGARTLVILLDAVPYATMARLTQPGDGGGLFADFGPPVPLISTFPSSTSMALAGILGAAGLELSPGYEARFFDWQLGRRRGGGPVSYFRVTFPWREYFDWNRKGPLRNALHAARPVRAGIRELAGALAAFEASGRETFTIYVADTDTAAHLFGPTGLDPILRELDADLRSLRRRQGAGLSVVLLSDHGLAGGGRLRNVLPDVLRAVAAHGWRRRDRLADERDVVLTPYGLVSSFEAYAAPSQAAALSRALAGVEGVDLCVTRDEGGWSVEGGDFALTFERRTGAAGDAWRWSLREGGGGLAAVLGKAAPAAGWVPDSELLSATAATEYPDPLYRLATAFAGVKNPASVVCSTAEGFMYGARGTERAARWTKGALRWTHGALRGDASLGFLMTSSPSAPAAAALRFDAALPLTMPAGSGITLR